MITLAGAPGVPGSANGTGTAARFGYARGVAVAPSGTVYVADTNNSTIRAITAAGVVTTLAGSPGLLGATNGTGAAARFNYPEGIAWNAATGTLLVADTQNNMIREVTTGGAVTTIAGQLGVGGFGGYVDGAIATALFKHPRGVTAATTGIIYVGDSGNDAVRVINAARTIVGTRAGGLAVFANPRGVAVDAAGNVYVADYNNHRIARVTPAGVVTTFAGSTTGVVGSANGTGTAARFSNPDGLARSGVGNLYVGDSGNNTIRSITAAGVVSTFAGGPPPAAAGSADGANASARFNDPRGVAINTAGNVYIADRGNSTIRLRTNANVFTITATAGANGTITPAGVMGVASGGSITFTITPNTNYAIQDVAVDGASVGAVTSRTFTNVTTNHTISATFSFVGFQITSSASANGAISPLGATNVPTGGNQAYTINPNTGYHIANVVVDGVPQGPIASYTFTNVQVGHSIVASFAINTYAITTTPGANGAITPANPTVNYGANQTFAIAGNAGYHVLDVFVDGVSQGPIASYQFTNVTTTHAISATFEADPPTGAFTAPVASATWPVGTSQPVNWHLAAAVDTGTFFVWAVNQTTGTWYNVTSQAAVTAQVDYSTLWTVSVPAGTYRLTLWHATATSPLVNLDYSSAVLTVTAVSGAFTAPVASATWPVGTSQPVNWHLAAAVGTGTFFVWAVNQTTGTWYSVTSRAAVTAQVDYSTSSNLNAPAGTYRLTLWYATATSPLINLDYSSAVLTVL